MILGADVHISSLSSLHVDWNTPGCVPAGDDLLGPAKSITYPIMSAVIFASQVPVQGIPCVFRLVLIVKILVVY